MDQPSPDMAYTRPVSLALAPPWALYVRRLRWRHGLDQCEFALRCGIALGQLRAIENGESEPDRVAIAQLVDMDDGLALMAKMRLAERIAAAA